MKTRFTGSFAKDLRRHRKNQELLLRIQRVIKNVEQAKVAREISAIKQLKTQGRYHRIRIGEYRVGITIEGNMVTFVRVLHRKEIYRFFP